MPTLKPRKLQPASKKKTCPICATVYTYPEKGSRATRFHCEPCAALPGHYRTILTKMGKRIQKLERALPKSPAD